MPQKRKAARSKKPVIYSFDSLILSFELSPQISLQFMLGVEGGCQEKKLGQYVETPTAIQCAAHHSLFNS
jgi:hypothetical protein